MTSALFSPLTVRGSDVRNRLWVSPMCQYSCEDRDGVVGDWHLAELGSFARGGAGLVMAEATAVLPEGRISPWCPGLWNDAQRDAWARITAFIASQGATPAVQLAHAGRKASTYREWSGSGTVPPSDGGWQSVSASPLAFPGYQPPVALDAAGIAEVVAAFAAAARRALEAGFEVIEVHAAHGYLMHQFLSPLTNKRDDQWGGSLENRARLLLDTVRAVRAEIGEDAPLVVRISATDWLEPDGWTLDQSVTLAGWLREAGVDVMDVSTGGNAAGVRIPTAPGYQVPHAQAVREGADIVTVAVGQIADAHQAEEIIASGKADVAMVARGFLRDPHLGLRWAADLGAEVPWPPQLARAPFPTRDDATR